MANVLVEIILRSPVPGRSPSWILYRKLMQRVYFLYQPLKAEVDTGNEASA